MKAQALSLLKGLIHSSQQGDELLRFLPREEASQIQQISSPEQFDAKELLSQDRWLQPIHFSWFSDFLKSYPTQVRSFFFTVLTAEQQKGIQDIPPKPLSPFMRPYLLSLLRQSLQGPNIIPETILPSSPLNLLLRLKRSDLVHLADFLGLHDLAADVRQIVDKALLQKIYQALTPQQVHFLQYASKQPVKWVSPKLGLLAWDGTKKQLNHLLHYRGLIRIGKVSYGEDPSFKWHLLHHFDTGRAKIIQKEYYQKQDPALANYFKNQVLYIAKRSLS